MDEPFEHEPLGVADAKRRFSELIDRVGQGERFVVLRRGRPAIALVPPDQVGIQPEAPAGLLSVVGALADWEGLEEAVADVYATRRRARDRPAPDLG